METQKTMNSQSNLEKDKWSQRNEALYFRQYYKATLIGTVWYQHKNRNTDQWNRIGSPEIKTYSYGHLIYYKGGQNIQWKKDSLFNKWCWENCSAICKRMKLEYSIIQYTKINSKWIKDLNARPDTINSQNEKIGRTFFNIRHSKISFDLPPTVMKIETKVNKWHLIKLKSFCIAKETKNKAKKQLSEWEKIFANEATDKELISKIYEKFIQLKKKKSQFKNGQKTKIDISPKKTYGWPTNT